MFYGRRIRDEAEEPPVTKEAMHARMQDVLDAMRQSLGLRAAPSQPAGEDPPYPPHGRLPGRRAASPDHHPNRRPSGPASGS